MRTSHVDTSIASGYSASDTSYNICKNGSARPAIVSRPPYSVTPATSRGFERRAIAGGAQQELLLEKIGYENEVTVAIGR